MNIRIDLTNIGGFPATQYTLKEMQDSYRGAFTAMANLAGNFAILYGVVVQGNNVSDGWISYNGEIMPFIGGATNKRVAITETKESRYFQDNNTHYVYFKKSATCAIVGDFDFVSLVPLQSLINLQNQWVTGDLKNKYCTADYVANNFDANGFGLNKEIGWQIFSSQVPASAGKTFVNLDPTDPDFNLVGNVVGAKTHKLTMPELPARNILNLDPNDGVNPGGFGMLRKSNAGDQTTPTGGDANGSSVEPDVFNIYPFPNLGSGNPISIIQPSFVVLTLIKL